MASVRARVTHVLGVLGGISAAACSAPSPDGTGQLEKLDAGPSGPDMCGDLRRAPEVYYGTEAPSLMPLSPGQMMAIGKLDGCSGTVISSRWVLTAAHCHAKVGESFCVGDAPAAAETCFQIDRVLDHPNLDLTLVELDEDVGVRAPDLLPIPIVVETMSDAWIGRMAEAAGYGVTETGSSGTRLFTAEPIVQLAGNYITIDGQGQRGVCFGDSGGPLMVMAGDGNVRLAGTLSFGDASCLDKDSFTRVDAARLWIEAHVGPIVVEGGACGSIDGVGRCFDGRAIYCAGDGLVADECTDGAACGWDDGAAGFRCISGSDPCGGVDRFGTCAGNVAQWCDEGVPKSRNCGCSEQICETSVSMGGAYCADDPCMGIDYIGQCQGDVAIWCDGGRLLQYDCAGDGETCGYVNADVGYWCQ